MDATLKATFWTDPRVEDLTAEEKLAAAWLVTNPTRDLCGFTRVSNRRFTFETKLDPSALEGVSKGLPSSFIRLPGNVFFAANFLRHQFGKGGRISLKNKVIVAAVRLALALKDAEREAFFAAYPELEKLIPEPAKNEGASIPLAENRHGVRVRVRVREGEGAREEGSGEKGPAVPPSEWVPDPISIVSAYPRREDMTRAVEYVEASMRRGADPRAILSGVRAIAAIIPKLPSGHLNAFVCSSGRFFKDERWRDDPATWVRNCAHGKNGAALGKLSLGGRKATILE
jgi:hypothetical protein